MKFKKGESGNPGGRPRGVKNKDTMQLREMITDFLQGNFEEVQKSFNELPPKDKAKLYCDLLQYGVPKLQAVHVETDFDNLSDEQLRSIIEELKNISHHEQK